MPEWLQKIIDKVKETWTKINTTQKLIVIGIAVAVVVGIVLLLNTTGKVSEERLYNKVLTQEDRNAVESGLSEIDVVWHYDSKGYIIVPSDRVSDVRAQLAEMGRQPDNLEPWAIFDVPAWTRTHTTENINRLKLQTDLLTQQLEGFSYIDDARVLIKDADKSLFTAQNTLPSVSVIVYTRPDVSLVDDRSKIRTIFNTVKAAIGETESIVISDSEMNDLTALLEDGSADYIKLTERQIKIRDRERAKIEDNIRDMLSFMNTNEYEIMVTLELDFSQEEEQRHEILPIVMVEDDPSTPYSEQSNVLGATVSRQNTVEGYTGDALRPEGPAGAEPNMPPAYPEVEGVVSRYSNRNQIENIEHSMRDVQRREDWWDISKIAVTVVVDGKWLRVYDENGTLSWTNGNQIKRIYEPRDEDQLANIEASVRNAIGYDRVRGDMVTVQNIPFNWDEIFRQESLQEWRKLQLRRALLILLIVMFVVFIGVLVYRAVQKEIERRRRLREEEEMRRQQMLREAALRAAESKPEEVVDWEERARREMQENAIRMAKERPEDVASLIRTWMAEE